MIIVEYIMYDILYIYDLLYFNKNECILHFTQNQTFDEIFIEFILL